MKFIQAILMLLSGLVCSHSICAQTKISINNLDSLLVTVKNPNDKVDQILKLLNQPENQYLDYKIAIRLANRALNIAQQTNYAKGKINSIIKLGNYYLKSGEYKNAMEFAQQAKEMAEDLNFNSELANSLALIGNTYSELGDFDNSSRYLFKSLKLFEKLEDKEGIARTLGDIGVDFYSQQYYKKALEYYNNSLTISKSIGNLPFMKKQYNNIAAVYGISKQYDTAIILYKNALEINLRLGDKLGQGINIMNIGYIQMNTEKFQDALANLRKSLSLLVKYSNNEHIAESNLNIAFCLYYLKEIDSSIIYFKNAIDIGQTRKYYAVIIEASKMLSQIYTEKRDLKSANKYLYICNNSLDSMNTTQKQDLLIKHELQYLYDKKEYENHLAQNARDKIMLIIIFSLISGLIIISLVLSKLRLKSKYLKIENEKIELEKEKVESELIIKNKELTVNLISLIRKNELLTDISHKLTQLEYNTTIKDTRDSIAKISKELRINTDDKMLNEFSLRFQEVHAGFYEKLQSTYPELTPNELKLCAFLRLNMTTKDIAELTGQQLTAINKARYRIRKKLTLSGAEDNLVTFLSQITS